MNKLKPSLSEKDHLRGFLGAQVTLVEFGDYECPYCGRAYAIVEAVREALGERLCFAFRQFPLSSMHPHALLAAQAAEAAGAQDRFWEMHDLLYRHQDALEPEDLEQYAVTLELDVSRFVAEVNGGRYEQRIRDDLRSGAISGVSGTPTFFVNGFRHEGSYDYDALMEALTTGRAPAQLGSF